MRGRTFSSWLLAGVLAGVAAAAPPSPGNPPKIPTGPGVPVPSLYTSYTVQLYDQGQSTRIPQFDPARGTLHAVSAKLTGVARYKVTLNGPVGAAADYAFTAYAPAYVTGNAWFDLKAEGSGSYANTAEQNISGGASGGGAAKGSNVLVMFTGKNTLGITLTPDLPKFSKGTTQIKNVEKMLYSVRCSVTYTYLPKLKPIIYKPK